MFKFLISFFILVNFSNIRAEDHTGKPLHSDRNFNTISYTLVDPVSIEIENLNRLMKEETNKYIVRLNHIAQKGFVESSSALGFQSKLLSCQSTWTIDITGRLMDAQRKFKEMGCKPANSVSVTPPPVISPIEKCGICNAEGSKSCVRFAPNGELVGVQELPCQIDMSKFSCSEQIEYPHAPRELEVWGYRVYFNGVKVDDITMVGQSSQVYEPLKAKLKSDLRCQKRN